MSHFIEKCRECGTVQAQCRCPSPSKEVRYVVCPKCAKEAGDKFPSAPKVGLQP